MSFAQVAAHIDKNEETGCWIWTGCIDKAKSPFPTPVIHVSKPKRKLVSVRRHAYEEHNQIGVPSNYIVTSICKNSLCVNPAHLTAQKRGVQGHRLVGSWRAEHCQHGHEQTQWTTKIQSNGCSLCVPCDKKRHRLAMERWRQDNPEHLSNVAKNRRISLRSWVIEQKTKCQVCGESNPLCLDFHHRDPGNKLFSISQESGNYSRTKLKAEMDKCDLLCSNCHRKLHAAEKAAFRISK